MGHCCPRASAPARFHAICCKLKRIGLVWLVRRNAYKWIKMCLDESRMDGAEASCDVAGHFREFIGALGPKRTADNRAAEAERVLTCFGSSTKPAACDS